MVPPGADEKRYHNYKTDFKFQNKLQLDEIRVSYCSVGVILNVINSCAQYFVV